eukprot:gnl/MRDRNA2_/MRDRNA2_56883_c0_seq1.p1 gnl/MRDRNA2_/MRDRNA2_56883_c0~~gnl/MRDRNA2_/MRDRNA2_56883_c0_seq1.p1  ORF type:complete len:146 (-),score=14.28 gnl/MRDRNA2_/MRDRNA2_56883_c0_seq1:388-825(-)
MYLHDSSLHLEPKPIIPRCWFQIAIALGGSGLMFLFVLTAPISVSSPDGIAKPRSAFAASEFPSNMQSAHTQLHLGDGVVRYALHNLVNHLHGSKMPIQDRLWGREEDLSGINLYEGDNPQIPNPRQFVANEMERKGIVVFSKSY